MNTIFCLNTFFNLLLLIQVAFLQNYSSINGISTIFSNDINNSDLITTNSVWEIKCSSSITNDHLLQVAIYAWLWRMVVEDMIMLENVMDFKIMNIKTGEHFILNATTEDLNNIILTILRGKYMEKKIQTREEFIESCL